MLMLLKGKYISSGFGKPFFNKAGSDNTRFMKYDLKIPTP